MPARIIGFCVALATILGFKSSKPSAHEMEDRISKAIDKSHQSWVEKGWVAEKSTTKV